MSFIDEYNETCSTLQQPSYIPYPTESVSFAGHQLTDSSSQSSEMQLLPSPIQFTQSDLLNSKQPSLSFSYNFDSGVQTPENEDVVDRVHAFSGSESSLSSPGTTQSLFSNQEFQGYDEPMSASSSTSFQDFYTSAEEMTYLEEQQNTGKWSSNQLPMCGNGFTSYFPSNSVPEFDTYEQSQLTTNHEQPQLQLQPAFSASTAFASASSSILPSSSIEESQNQKIASESKANEHKPVLNKFIDNTADIITQHYQSQFQSHKKSMSLADFTSSNSPPVQNHKPMGIKFKAVVTQETMCNKKKEMMEKRERRRASNIGNTTFINSSVPQLSSSSSSSMLSTLTTPTKKIPLLPFKTHKYRSKSVTDLNIIIHPIVNTHSRSQSTSTCSSPVNPFYKPPAILRKLSNLGEN
ncbi:unnamed protein product [Ambrosiozyma monospora]|uniref:Unnamed protein product n=1 Tax=Ambrosiozyma monospora TaxID=43982 RepID=A0ACB5ST26_AMBMO|nr:unnamed protein product [Ambrosiozyma monospora]